MIWTATQSRLAIQFYAMNKVWTSFNSLERSNNRPQNATRRCKGKSVQRGWYCVVHVQYPIIRNSLIRNSAEFLGKSKKQALGRSNLRNA